MTLSQLGSCEAWALYGKMMLHTILLLWLTFTTRPTYSWTTQNYPSIFHARSPCDASTLGVGSTPDDDAEERLPSHPVTVAERSSADTTEARLTTALLQISYDGAHFSGWSAANDSGNATVPPLDSIDPGPPPFAAGRRRRRGRNRRARGFVRSVQGVLRTNLAKLYGNADPARVVVEGCSRTDRGVHATGAVLQFYCLTDEGAAAIAQQGATALPPPVGQPSIPGKRTPHPRNATDASCFAPIPRDLSQLVFALNRMCWDIQVTAFAPTPSDDDDARSRPFHPTLSARSKTYRYRFSVGPMHDPTQRRLVWHVGDSVDGESANWSSKEAVRQACSCLQGRHDFAAFRGAARGPDDKRRRIDQDTVCTIHSITIEEAATWQNTTTFTLEVKGDRFLYKMVRFLVGAVVAVGQDKLSVDDVDRLLETGVRRENEFECAPAHGLVLHDVEYDPPIEWHPATS